MADNDPKVRDTAGGPEPAGRVRRVWLISGVAFIVVLAAAAGAFAFLRGGADHRPEHTGNSPSANGSACRPLVVDRGFTVHRAYRMGHRADKDYDVVAYGVVVTNPCRHVVSDVQVLVSALDASGNAVRTNNGDGHRVTEKTTIPVLAPGERLGVPGSLPNGLQRTGDYYDPSDVAKLGVRLPERTQCWTSHTAVTGQATATAKHVQVGSPDADGHAADRSALISFALSLRPRDAAVRTNMVYVLFHDSSGRILSGGAGSLPDHPHDGQQVTVKAWLPPRTDPARTSVYFAGDPDRIEQLTKPLGSCSAR